MLKLLGLGDLNIKKQVRLIEKVFEIIVMITAIEDVLDSKGDNLNVSLLNLSKKIILKIVNNNGVFTIDRHTLSLIDEMNVIMKEKNEHTKCKCDCKHKHKHKHDDETECSTDSSQK